MRINDTEYGGNFLTRWTYKSRIAVLTLLNAGFSDVYGIFSDNNKEPADDKPSDPDSNNLEEGVRAFPDFLRFRHFRRGSWFYF